MDKVLDIFGIATGPRYLPVMDDYDAELADELREFMSDQYGEESDDEPLGPPPPLPPRPAKSVPVVDEQDIASLLQTTPARHRWLW